MSDPINVIRNVQAEYFTLLKEHFKKERHQIKTGIRTIGELLQDKISTEESGIIIPTAKKNISSFEYQLNSLFADICAFWKKSKETIHKAIRELDYLTICHNLWSLDSQSIIRRYSLYFDTICIPDPLQYDLSLEDLLPEEIVLKAGIRRKKTEIFALYFQVLDLEKLVLADCKPPICLIYPSALYTEYDLDKRPAQQYALDMTTRFYNLLMEHSGKEKPLDEVIFEITKMPEAEIEKRARRSPALFALWETPPSTNRVIDLFYRNYPQHTVRYEKWKERLTKGLEIQVSAFSTYYANNYEGKELLSEFCIDPAHWKLCQWIMELEQSLVFRESQLSERDAMIKILRYENLSWLGNVTISDIIRLRENNQLDEMRKLFRINSKELRRARIDEYSEIASKIDNDLQIALAEHSLEIRKRRKELRKKFVLSLTGYAITASLAIASAAFPLISLLAIASATATVGVGGPGIMDLMNMAKTGNREDREVSSRPSAILLKANEERN